MTAIYPIVSFGLNDAPTKASISSVVDIYGSPSGSFKQSFSNLNDLAVGNKTIVPYASYEPDYWVLDGNYHFMPTSPKIGYMDSRLSDSSGNTNTIVVSIFFSSLQNVSSMTLYFDVAHGEWCNNIKVEFFTAGGSMIWGSGILYPTSPTYNLTCSVANADHVNITIYKTSQPYRFARLTGVDFGTITYIDKTKIKSAKIVEEISPISSTVTMNTLDLDLFLDSSDFSITNPSSPYNLPQRMPFTVYEVFGNETTFMGQFYLDKWDNITNHEVTFHCVDAMGLLDKTPWYGWVGLSGLGVTNVKTILDFMFSMAGIPYSAPADLNTFNLYGYIDPGSTRDALQQIAMACRLTVNCARSYKVGLTHTTFARDLVSYDYTIGLSGERINQVKLLPLVDGTKIGFTGIDEGIGASSVQIYNNTLAVGKNRIALGANLVPKTGVTKDVSSTVIGNVLQPTNWTNAGAYFYLIDVTTAGTLILNSFSIDNRSGDMVKGVPVYTYLNPVSTSQNIIEIVTNNFSDGGTAWPYFNGVDMNTWIYNYYQQRNTQKSTIYNSLIGAGNSVFLGTWDSRNLKAIVERAEIELVGLRTDIEVVGVIA